MSDSELMAWAAIMLSAHGFEFALLVQHSVNRRKQLVGGKWFFQVQPEACSRRLLLLVAKRGYRDDRDGCPRERLRS